jgi:hypothetical protein
MTATIHLTDAQRDTFAACGIIVIDGEYSADSGERALQRMQQMNMPQGSDKFGRGYHQVTGHPLVASEGWRILTEPCPTCGGDECFRAPELPVRCGDPDCHRGARVVTLTATCPIEWFSQDDCTDARCTEGKVTLGRFIIPTLLPVVPVGEPKPGTDCVTVEHDGPQLWRFHETGHLGAWEDRFTLDPAPRPGQFIARPEAVA